MQAYGYAGEVLLSTIPLPELAAEPLHQGGRRWICRPAPMAGIARGGSADTADADDEVTRRIVAMANGEWVIEFTVGATFHIAGDTVTWSVPAETDADVLRHLLLDHTLPLALSTRARLVLHASSVEMQGAVVGFMGPSGVGKSTLAAACQARGGAVIGDDCVILRGQAGSAWTASPTYSGLRLWPDALDRYAASGPRFTIFHDSTKRRVPTPPRDGTAVALARLYAIERSPRAASVTITTASAATAMAILRNEFRLDLLDRATVARRFDDACALVQGGLVRRLLIPDRADAVDAAVDAVLADLTEAYVPECA
jgi:hypothetical protein